MEREFGNRRTHTLCCPPSGWRDDDRYVPRVRHLAQDRLKGLQPLQGVWAGGSDRSDVPAFYKAVDELPNRDHRDFLPLLLFTGLRRGEAASLRWDYVDLRERMIRLPATGTKAKRKLDLPMSDYVFDLLTKRLAVGVEGEFVFPSHSQSGHLEEERFSLQAAATSRSASRLPNTTYGVRSLRLQNLATSQSTRLRVWSTIRWGRT